METHFEVPSHAIAILETLTNIVDIRVERSLTADYFIPRDYTPPNTLVELSFPPPPIRDGKVRELDLYEWLASVARTVEQEEVQVARVPSIARLYEEEDCQEFLASLRSREEALAGEAIAAAFGDLSGPGAEEGAAEAGPIVERDDFDDDLPLPSRWDWDAYGTWHG